MKKIYFLISTLIAFLMPSFIISSNVNYENINTKAINIDSSKYLNLSYQNGNFYSWDQTDNSKQHVIGIFTNNEQSYLLDNFGLFWNLNYQISNFYRVSDKIGIAQITYFQNKNKEEYFSKSFFVQLENNKMTISQTPIASENPFFAVLTQNNTKYVVAYGIGLDLIEIETQNVKNLIVSEKSTFMTTFYRIDDNNGIFVAHDQYFYLLKDITGTLKQEKINLKASIKNINSVVVLNNKNLVIRDEKNALFFVNFEQDIIINKWKKNSIAKNFAFVLNQDTFILNISSENSGFEYGLPYLVKTNNWRTLIKIPNIKSINDFMFISDNNGIFIDKNLVANTFIYQAKDNSFITNNFGNLNSFQFINKDLLFGSVQNDNLLITQKSNPTWAIMKNVQFTPNSYGNFLNTIINSKGKDIDFQNTYFSNDSVNFSVTDKRLIEVAIINKLGQKRILKPKKGNVTYNFLNFDDYQITIKFLNDDTNLELKYHVKIKHFTNQNLLNVSGRNIVSYVGASDNNLENKLYDITSIDQVDKFTIEKYDYNYLQYVQLFTYDDTKNMVVKNVFNITENSQIKADVEDKNFFFGLKMVNLLNYSSWIYLGFSKNGVQPMIDFWDTEFGKNLMNNVLSRRYLEVDLKKMDSHQVLQLIQISNTWHAIEIQGKAIVIVIISIFSFALIAVIFSLTYNIYLNKKITIKSVEHNKVLKNPLDL